MLDCRTIWGPGDYDLDIESDDDGYHLVYIRRDYGFEFRVPLSFSRGCSPRSAIDNVCHELALNASEIERKKTEEELVKKLEDKDL